MTTLWGGFPHLSHKKKQQPPPPPPHPIRSSPPKPCSGQPWWKSGVNRWCTPRRRRRDHPDPPLQPPECFTAGLFVSLKKSHVFFGKKGTSCDISNLHDFFQVQHVNLSRDFVAFGLNHFFLHLQFSIWWDYGNVRSLSSLAQNMLLKHKFERTFCIQRDLSQII